MEREAKIVLQDYDPVTCIEKLSTKHPEYSKKISFKLYAESTIVEKTNRF